MRIWIILFVGITLLWILPEESFCEEVRVYAPDGQRRSNLLSIYTNIELTSDNAPMLKLLECERLIKDSESESDAAAKHQWSPVLIVGDTGWEGVFRGKSYHTTGTLLLFDISAEYGFSWWVPGEKVRPVLVWKTVEAETVTAIGERVYLANNTGAVFWALVGITFALAVLWLLSAVSRKEWHPGHALSRYVEDADGRMSLSLMQMALWTLAVGALVLGFAFVRVRVPQIPTTLVVLMGLSAGTGLIGHWQVKQELRARPDGNAGAARNNQQRHGQLSDLINIGSADGVARASLAKAQLLFWTLLAAGLFVFKSLQDGELWEVNEQLVALMGISQASFLGRKQVEIGRRERAEKEAATQTGQGTPE